MGQSPLVQHWSPVQGPQPDTSGNCKIMDMGPVCHIVACLVIPGTNLYVLVTEVHGCHCVNCQLLAQRCYLIVTWLGIKLMTTWSGVPLPIVTPPSQCVCNNSTQLKFIENGSRMAKRIQNTVHKNKSNEKCEWNLKNNKTNDKNSSITNSLSMYNHNTIFG